MTLSLVQWAFDVKHPKQDSVMNNEDYDMDDDGTCQVFCCPFKTLHWKKKCSAAWKDSASLMSSVRAQWQKLCHSNFAPLCIDVLLRVNNGTPDLVLSGKSLVYRFCDVLATLILSTGRSHVLTVAANFTNPPPALLALLSAMTVEQSPWRSTVLPQAIQI
uniref:Uncharacterized protein n=1 Tax=Peronospora matthiolae TaxID=2874970 RepID=A0AAV1UID2_9STRA